MGCTWHFWTRKCLALRLQFEVGMLAPQQGPGCVTHPHNTVPWLGASRSAWIKSWIEFYLSLKRKAGPGPHSQIWSAAPSLSVRHSGSLCSWWRIVCAC